jgi:hypothetical protein
MQKLFYLLFEDEETPGAKLRDGLLSQAATAIHASGGSELFVFVNDEAVSEGGLRIRRSDPPIRACVSFWLEDAADRMKAEEALSQQVRQIAGYLVLESRPMIHRYTKGERSPGMKQITCIARRPDLSQEDFIEIWHGDHCQVAIETQSTFGYVRNEIFRSLAPDAPGQWTAFVEESFPIEALVDPKVFYDARSEADLQRNAERMQQSCARFLDFEALEVTYTSEYYLG